MNNVEVPMRTRACDHCGLLFTKQYRSHKHCSVACIIWSKVSVSGPDDCWEWQAGKNSDGYGNIEFREAGQVRSTFAHRMAYQVIYGSIPESQLVCHECDNPPCCNPNHLFLGTMGDNIRDSVLKGRRDKPDGTGDVSAKLKLADVHAILKDDRSHHQIAKSYGVSHTQVWKIKTGRAWARFTKIERQANP